MREDEIGLNEGDARDVSPDGRTVMRRSMGHLPGDIHEISPIYSVNVFDARSRELVLALGRYREFDSSHEWEPDGAALVRVGPVRLRISVAEGNWSMDRDGWQAHPLDGDIAAAHTLLDPHFPVSRYGLMADRAEQPSIKPSRQRLKDAALITAFCLAAAGNIYLYMTGQTEMQKLFRYADEYIGSN
ncbi:hypothetical protein [Mesorhizobium sp. 2RAF21]|jgi:hypothetical protein|uniref:hypothetical protein n=1 Tax=Mesorhizobium sp. 2RAF21 TaxID=3232995 RepID=UPI003F99A833